MDDWQEDSDRLYPEEDWAEEDEWNPAKEAFIEAWFTQHFPAGSDGPYDGWEADADCAYDEHRSAIAQAEAEAAGVFDMPDMPEPGESE